MAGIAAYWAYACECEYWATNMHDEQDRQIFLEMAGAWSELALKQQSAFQNTGTRPLLDKQGRLRACRPRRLPADHGRA